MISWLTKLYLLIRGDRFANDKIEKLQDEIYHIKLELTEQLNLISSKLNKIEYDLQLHSVSSAANYELLEQKINNNKLANEIMLKMLDDRFESINILFRSLQK